MEEANNQSPKKQYKYTSSESQFRAFRNYLSKNTATCSMASDALGIPQKNLTRYKRSLQEAGQLVEVFESECPITGFKAAFLSTNQVLIKSLLK